MRKPFSKASRETLPRYSMELEYLPTFTPKRPSFVGKYSIHGAYGLDELAEFTVIESSSGCEIPLVDD